MYGLGDLVQAGGETLRVTGIDLSEERATQAGPLAGQEAEIVYKCQAVGERAVPRQGVIFREAQLTLVAASGRWRLQDADDDVPEETMSVEEHLALSAESAERSYVDEDHV